MKIRLAGIVDDSIVDGPGLRFSVFTQGCSHHCDGCHNPQTHAFDGGFETDTEDITGKVLRTSDGDVLILGNEDIHGKPICSDMVERLKGDPLRVPLLS